jgi:hypothetical protein
LGVFSRFRIFDAIFGDRQIEDRTVRRGENKGVNQASPNGRQKNIAGAQAPAMLKLTPD